MLIEQQLAAALLPLVNDRAYPITLPQNTDYPALTFHRVDTRETEEDYRLSPLKLRRARGMKSLFQVVIWSKKYSDCARLLRQCKTTLEALDGVYLENAADGYEHELQLYTCVTEFAVWCDLDSGQSPSGSSGQLNAVVDAVAHTLKTNLPEQDIAPYNPLERTLPLPAIRIDLNSLQLDEETGNGLLPAKCEFVAWCCCPSVGHQAAEVAARVLETIRFNHWGLGADVSHPANLTARPAEFRPGQAGFSTWVVSWEQTVYLGELEKDSGVLPDTVMVGVAPDIGQGNESKYEQL